MKTVTDIDIDLADRDKLLERISHTAASMIVNDDLKKHNVGVYLQMVPTDPLTGLCSIPYEEAEERGYFKLDLLNVRSYGLDKIRDEDHLNELINREPVWDMLLEESIVCDLFQLGFANYPLVRRYAPKSIEELAMVLALMRPGKKHLVGMSFRDLEDTIWLPTEEYYFKKSHSISYAMAIVVQMNLLVEQVMEETNVDINEETA